ncbi:hypothetical protein [Phycicoccus flavus]|uniref:hypothetical protein n=1 Tax=Phycicoccus flavus TaxID=2502783 RepID=UPI000FEBD07F|nr:hypothetical protein [Phycicoccus flavus]NHA68115.1 hypothetical protein [Phycicoccus flavus]
MSRVRTALVALAAGAAVVTGGVVAVSATAAPPAAAPSAPSARPSADAPDAAPGERRHPGRHHGRGPGRHWWKGLGDEQRQCLRDADITRPVGPLSREERRALREEVAQAADACGVELPGGRAHGFWRGLTDEQRQCLRDADVTRPWGPMTKDQRRQVRDDLRAAARSCGVQPPARHRPDLPSPS